MNLLEVYAVAVKHYLRGEDGIFHEDLYHLVRFLPSYVPTISSADNLDGPRKSSSDNVPASPPSGHSHRSSLTTKKVSAPGQLPLPTTAPTPTLGVATFPTHNTLPDDGRPQRANDPEKISLAPAMNPPKYSLFDLFPFSLLGRTRMKGLGARMRNHRGENIPLEISLYLVRFSPW